MTRACWVPGVDAGDPFGLTHLPYGAASSAPDRSARLVVRIGDYALDLAAACERLRPDLAASVSGPVLNPLLTAGPEHWRELRTAVQEWLSNDAHRSTVEELLAPVATLTMVLAFEVADYVDFYASEYHARNVGQILRPQSPALAPNWKSLPVGYHGRAGTVVVSGTPIHRPSGQWRTDAGVEFGPTRRLDFEVEVGFVLGGPTERGQAVPIADALDHIFGICLLNDWSARDIQAWETVPLGPFLGKSFSTSVAAWITPLAALTDAWCDPPPRDPPPLAYLDDTGLSGALAIELAVALNGEVISRPRFESMYWTPAQMLAHLTVNGASIRAGDLFASGTVSGAEPAQRGCLLELSWGATVPIELADGTSRTFLTDGDQVTITASVQSGSGRIQFGEVTGRICRD